MTKKRKSIYVTFTAMKTIALLLLLLLGAFQSTTIAQREIVLVIDPGHGGNDPGHESEYAGHKDEKELNLSIAKYLGGYIEKYLSNVKVVYTRTSDKTVSLDDRVAKANSINADYFLSIHCNGNDNKVVRGTESHVHDLSAKKATSFARLIERQFSSRAGRRSRGVKNKKDLKHSLQVLKYTKMPSVLVECGFLTNRKEANFLNTTYGQEIIASAMFRAFRSCVQQQHPSINFKKSKTGSTSGSYSIQIMSSKKALDTNGSSFKRLKTSVRRKELNTKSAYKYIYLVGNYSSKAEAKKALPSIQGKGFRDAFIVSN